MPSTIAPGSINTTFHIRADSPATFVDAMSWAGHKLSKCIAPPLKAIANILSSLTAIFIMLGIGIVIGTYAWSVWYNDAPPELIPPSIQEQLWPWIKYEAWPWIQTAWATFWNTGGSNQ